MRCCVPLARSGRWSTCRCVPSIGAVTVPCTTGWGAAQSVSRVCSSRSPRSSCPAASMGGSRWLLSTARGCARTHPAARSGCSAMSTAAGRTGRRAVLTWVLGVVGTSALWWWTAHLMLRGEVRWRALLPTAIVTGVGSSLYTMASSVWMPTRVSNDFAQFDTFGIALSFVTWLTGLCFLLVGAAVLGPALTDGADVVGRWLRSGEATALQPWAEPALPGPVRPVRLSDAFGRGSGGSGVHHGHRSDAPPDPPPSASVESAAQ